VLQQTIYRQPLSTWPINGVGDCYKGESLFHFVVVVVVVFFLLHPQIGRLKKEKK
jgi:hypothetical protein